MCEVFLSKNETNLRICLADQFYVSRPLRLCTQKYLMIRIEDEIKESTFPPRNCWSVCSKKKEKLAVKTWRHSGICDENVDTSVSISQHLCFCSLQTTIWCALNCEQNHIISEISLTLYIKVIQKKMVLSFQLTRNTFAWNPGGDCSLNCAHKLTDSGQVCLSTYLRRWWNEASIGEQWEHCQLSSCFESDVVLKK